MILWRSKFEVFSFPVAEPYLLEKIITYSFYQAAKNVFLKLRYKHTERQAERQASSIKVSVKWSQAASVSI